MLKTASWDRPVWRRGATGVRRFAELGVLPTDSAELRLRKSILTLSSALMVSLAFVWVATYSALGLWLPAAIPFAYQIASVASIVLFFRTRRFEFFGISQLWMSLLLPFVLQWSLGGFRTSSAVAMWGFVAPIGALLFFGTRGAARWFAGFAALVAVSGALDSTWELHAPDVPNGVIVSFFVLNIVGVTGTTYFLLEYFVRERDRALTSLEVERGRSERLLLNVLPATVAERLKQSDDVIADAYETATVLFADIAGFTPLAARLEPEQLVALLDRVFASWDELAARHGVEKIKTIGDAYMVAGGIPAPRADHAEAIAQMALMMGSAVEHEAIESGVQMDVRIGIDSGPVVAGVIGRSKFSYDLWGDTVNTASRMESHGLPGEIQVTERAYELLRERFDLTRRGDVDVKGKGPMTTYLLVGGREDLAAPASAS